MTYVPASFRSKHFDIQELADGVFGVIGPQRGLCHSNAAIIDLGDRTLIYDTLTLPSYGADLADACRKLTGREPTWIALSHFHSDHWLGNQAFSATTPILATHAMMPQMEEWMSEYGALSEEVEEFQQQVDAMAASAETEQDSQRKDWIQTNVKRYSALIDEAQTLRIVRPNTTFEGTLRLMGSKRAVELIEYRQAHTVSDVALAIPDDGILCMGDLGFFHTIPYLAYADPLHWIDILREFESSKFTTFVPGHGIVGGTELVTLQRECLEAVVSAVRVALDSGSEIDESLLQHLPEPFKGWATRGQFNKAAYVAVADSIRSTV